MFAKAGSQVLYNKLLQNMSIPIVVGTGPAGTGKTFIASYIGAQKLASGAVKKLVLTRPAVSVDEQHGYLPGTIEQKMAPWTRPIFDSLGKYYNKKEIKALLADEVIEICPLAYMRGRTFDNAWVIADEMQNSTSNQMKMILTRIGQGSRIVITGDVTQVERGFTDNGLSDFIARLGNIDGIGHVEFSESDITRHYIIKDILSMYEKNIIQ
jgi:phosphate starvation-inducible PhoH-like protein